MDIAVRRANSVDTNYFMALIPKYCTYRVSQKIKAVSSIIIKSFKNSH